MASPPSSLDAGRELAAVGGDRQKLWKSLRGRGFSNQTIMQLLQSATAATAHSAGGNHDDDDKNDDDDNKNDDKNDNTNGNKSDN